jgi:hypothetical protein
MDHAQIWALIHQINMTVCVSVPACASQPQVDLLTEYFIHLENIYIYFLISVCVYERKIFDSLSDSLSFSQSSLSFFFEQLRETMLPKECVIETRYFAKIHAFTVVSFTI